MEIQSIRLHSIPASNITSKATMGDISDIFALGSETTKVRSSEISTNQDYYSSVIDGFINEFKSGSTTVLGTVDLNEIERSFNWGADGSSTLNDSQISYLQGKYSLSNMSEKDYLNLMMDLNQMNVITAKDIISQYVGVEPRELTEKGVLVTDGAEFINMSNVPANGGNILSASRNHLSVLGNALNNVINHINQFSAETFFFYKEAFAHNIAMYSKLNDIFEVIG